MNRVYAIVPSNYTPAQALQYCNLSNTTEYVTGLPPSLVGVIDPTTLPMVFTEVIPDPVITLTAAQLVGQQLSAAAPSWGNMTADQQASVLGNLGNILQGA